MSLALKTRFSAWRSRMLRRHLVQVAVASFLILPFAVHAQNPSIPVIGFFGMAGAESHVADIKGLRDGLTEFGYEPDRTIIIEEAYAAGQTERVGELIDGLLTRRVELIIVPGLAAALAVHDRAPDLPIVGVGLPSTVVDPELYASLQRPGGKVTGFSHFGEDLATKRIELLREFVPSMTKIAILHTSVDPLYRAWGEKTGAAAQAQGLEVVRIELRGSSESELEAMMATLPDHHVGGMIVVRDFLTATLLEEIVTMSTDLGLPVIAEQRKWAESGALISYGANLPDLFRRAASYVDEILKGGDPALMPIQLATKFELVINGRTADRFGLTISKALQLRADEVIE